jgi:hypothetical protein
LQSRYKMVALYRRLCPPGNPVQNVRRVLDQGI